MLLMEWKVAAPLIYWLRPPGLGYIIYAKSLKAGSCLIWKEIQWCGHEDDDLSEVKMHIGGLHQEEHYLKLETSWMLQQDLYTGLIE